MGTGTSHAGGGGTKTSRAGGSASPKAVAAVQEIDSSTLSANIRSIINSDRGFGESLKQISQEVGKMKVGQSITRSYSNSLGDQESFTFKRTGDNTWETATKAYGKTNKKKNIDSRSLAQSLYDIYTS